METTAILLIAVPTFLPLILQLGIDPVHFGLIIILNLLIGATTPPFGVLLFIVQDIAKVSFGRMVQGDAAVLRAAAASRCCWSRTGRRCRSGCRGR